MPTVKDRVVQTAAALVIEPIFEADLMPEQYAYRSGRGALEAVKQVRALLKTGRRDVVDADLSGYFDSIPRVELMKSAARRIVDRRVLRRNGSVLIGVAQPPSAVGSMAPASTQARRLALRTDSPPAPTKTEALR